MVIAGAKGLAKELLEILAAQDALKNLCFFDDVSGDAPQQLFGQFPVLRTLEDAKEVFEKTGDTTFALGLGNPALRYKLYNTFSRIGGTLISVISNKADIGKYGVSLQPGCCILPGVVITSSVSLGKGCLLNPNVTVSHDSVLGDFVEASPGAKVTGNCHVGDFSFLGTNSSILPRVRIGRNVIVGAGAVVTKDVPDNCMVAGVPAAIKKTLTPLTI
jgi:sugar O-acyltransferase (sialic acid O-acetyltransferase NeuD family)